MDNLAIARILAEIGDLLEIRGDNPFKIRAYRNAADTIADEPSRVADMTEARLLELPGIGRDLAKKIREIVETGDTAFHRELLEEFPPTMLDLLRLPGLGPRTVRQLYVELGIRTLADLESAARDGRLETLRGMGPKKRELILKAVATRQRYAGRHLLPEMHDVAAALVASLRAHLPEADIVPVGSLRRGCETCGDLDILVSGADRAAVDRFVRYRLVEEVLAHGETRASVRLRGDVQADLRLVPAESRGAAMQYFTGSKAHNIALRDRALQRGLKLNEYGLYRIDDGARIAGDTEEGIYEALGLAWIPPELRENRGEIEAAERRLLPRLIDLADLQGDLHSHTTTTDGRDDIETMARAAKQAGLRYLAITDHSQSLTMSNGLDERRALEHARRIREVGSRIEGLKLLAGIECDIRPDGALDLADDCLAQLDYVVASVHSAFSQDASQMTDRLLRAIENPWVHTIGHPTGRKLLKREPHKADMTAVVKAAARTGVALEINCQIDRLDLSDVNARLALEHGAKLIVASDSHSQAGFGVLRWGIMVARRAWAGPGDVLNTLPLDAFLASLRPRPASRPSS
ncbi:MAG TPA: DNA polymerase/3'-5' exonuclease PolX [Vicinamibacterales bacterium]|nr:DNA polymerase/3'-5' exonuclease PolX [Vicinamibacterales bacterium]